MSSGRAKILAPIFRAMVMAYLAFRNLSCGDLVFILEGVLGVGGVLGGIRTWEKEREPL